jgi:hypothetical protein
LKTTAERAKEFKQRLKTQGFKNYALILHESELEKLEKFKRTLKYYKRG